MAALVLGWALRPVAIELRGAAPTVSWLPVLALLLVAAILAAVARSTYKLLHVRKRRLPPHQAVNRLVLAKACALVGALATGGYLGHALSWVGSPAELGTERIVMSLVAALGAALAVLGSLLLERACRVSQDEDES